MHGYKYTSTYRHKVIYFFVVKIIRFARLNSKIIQVYTECGSCLKGKQRQRFGDMGLIELRKTNNFQPQSHF